MSSMQQPPVAPQPGPSPYQPPREPNISARTLIAVVAVVFIVLIGIVLVMLLLSGGGSGNSPEGALNGFAAGVNSGDAKEAFDHTILALMPGYEDQIDYLGGILLMGDPHIEINSVTEIDNETMTSDQLEEAEDIIDEMLMYLDIDVEDMAFVEYNMTMEYEGIGDGAETLEGQMLCVKVDGTWYLAMLTFFDEF